MKIINEKLGKHILGNSPEFSIVIDPHEITFWYTVGIHIYEVSMALDSQDPLYLKFEYMNNLEICQDYYAETGKGA